MLLLLFQLGFWLSICSKATAEYSSIPFCQIGPERYTPAPLVSYVSPEAALRCPHPLTPPPPSPSVSSGLSGLACCLSGKAMLSASAPFPSEYPDIAPASSYGHGLVMHCVWPGFLLTMLSNGQAGPVWQRTVDVGSGTEILLESCHSWFTRDFSKKEAEVCPRFRHLPPGLYSCFRGCHSVPWRRLEQNTDGEGPCALHLAQKP